MHYYIDGYNMLFRNTQSPQDLQAERELLLEDLNKKVTLLNLNVSIVFDATFQSGGRSRSHLDVLEILYTGEGETADEFILDMLSHTSTPHRKVIVTSDKILASHARHFSAKVESIEYFVQWLNRVYENRLKFPKKIKRVLPPLPAKKPSPPIVVEQLPQKEFERESDYYQRVFETEYREISEKEDREKAAKKSVKNTRQPKIRKDPFNEPQKISDAATETERWQKAFEKRLKNPDKF